MKRYLLPCGVIVAVLVIFVPNFVQKLPLPLRLKADTVSFPKMMSMQQQAQLENINHTELSEVVEQAALKSLDMLLSAVWTVQIQQFVEQAKAEVLMQQLREQHFRAFIQASGDRWQVIVGPELDQESLRDLTKRLAAQGYQGTYVHYHPLVARGGYGA